MKLFLAILLFAGDAVFAGPTQCFYCSENFQGYCSTSQQNQKCATDPYSLGTTHCGSAAIQYRATWSSSVNNYFFRGCFDCTNKKAACFALGGYLRTRRDWIVLKCEVECCNGSNCNTNVTTLSENAITVFTPDAPGPAKCYKCLENDADTCTLQQDTQTCRDDSYSLGETHCGSATIKFRDVLSGSINVSVIRGCIDCADKKAACAAIAGSLKYRRLYGTLLECNIECCNGSYCNDGAKDLTTCNHCMERDEASCSSTQKRQICPLDQKSLGASHCGSAVGKYRSQNGLVQDFFYRGCFDCEDKKAACFALGGFYKGDVQNVGHTTVLQCDIECCSGINCNYQNQSLLPAAVTVFTPTVSGPAQCNVCLEKDATSCSKNQQVQVCATNPYSLGTTHCGSAVGRYLDSKGNSANGFFRGCINCADKKAACAALGGFRKNVQKWTQLECEIECCTGELCNTHIPTLIKDAGATRDVQLILLIGALALAVAFANVV